MNKEDTRFSVWVTKTFLECNSYGNGDWWHAIFFINFEGEQFFCKQDCIAKKLLYYRVLIIQLLGKCSRGNKIAPLWHTFQRGTILLPLSHLSSNSLLNYFSIFSPLWLYEQWALTDTIYAIDKVYTNKYWK